MPDAACRAADGICSCRAREAPRNTDLTHFVQGVPADPCERGSAGGTLAPTPNPDMDSGGISDRDGLGVITANASARDPSEDPMQRQ